MRGREAYKHANKEWAMTAAARNLFASYAPPRLVVAVLACLATTAAAGAKPAYDLEDVKACSPDAMRLCKDKLPDLDAIQLCMKENYDRLRPACKARFDKH